MDLITRSAGSYPVLEVSGRFDAHATPPVNDWLDARSSTPPAQLIVNLSGVTFIDSTALAALVRAMKHCREQGGDLHVCCLQQPVRIIFELTRLDRAMRMLGTEKEAMDAFGG